MTITANGSGNTINAVSMTLFSGVTTLATPLAGDALAISTALVNYNGTNSGSVLKTGLGTVTLSSGNTYFGGTTVSAGTLRVGNATALGGNSGSVSVTSGAVLDLNGTTMTGTNALTLNGTGISSGGALINSSATAGTYAGLITLGSASSIVAGGGNITISNTGTITGATFGLTLDGTKSGSLASIIGTTSGTLTKNGTGTWTLTGANTFSGQTIINNGAVSIATLAAIGSAQPLGENATLTLGGAATTGTLIYTGAAGTLTQATVLGAGGGTIINSSPTGLLTLSNTLTKTGAVLTLNGGAKGIKVSGLITGTNGSIFNSDLDITGGTVTLSTAANYFGPTVIFGNGTLVNGSGAANVLPTSTVLTLGATGETNTTTNTYNMAGFNQTVAGLATIAGANNIVTSSVAGTIALTVNNDTSTSNANYTYGGVIQNGSGVVGLIKSGDHTLTLGGNNTFTGGVTINGGVLQLGNAGALNSSTPNAVTFGPSVAAGTKLQLNGNSVTIAGIITNATPGSPVIEDTNATAATLTLNTTANNTYAGVLQDGASGTLALTKIAAVAH